MNRGGFFFVGGLIVGAVYCGIYWLMAGHLPCGWLLSLVALLIVSFLFDIEESREERYRDRSSKRY